MAGFHRCCLADKKAIRRVYKLRQSSSVEDQFGPGLTWSDRPAKQKPKLYAKPVKIPRSHCERSEV